MRPPMPDAEGLWSLGHAGKTPRPQRHKSMILWKMVGPPGLEPGYVGYGGLLGQLSRAALL